MKRITTALAVLFTLPTAVTGTAAAQYPLPDAVDCGPDTREWMDPQVDVDFPQPPPQELKPLLMQLGCPTDGKPHYRGPFDPEAGSPDPPRDDHQYDVEETERTFPEGDAADEAAVKKNAKQNKAKRCKKRGKGAKKCRRRTRS